MLQLEEEVDVDTVAAVEVVAMVAVEANMTSSVTTMTSVVAMNHAAMISATKVMAIRITRALVNSNMPVVICKDRGPYARCVARRGTLH
jgi:hypothetical protein